MARAVTCSSKDGAPPPPNTVTPSPSACGRAGARQRALRFAKGAAVAPRALRQGSEHPHRDLGVGERGQPPRGVAEGRNGSDAEPRGCERLLGLGELDALLGQAEEEGELPLADHAVAAHEDEDALAAGVKDEGLDNLKS